MKLLSQIIGAASFVFLFSIACGSGNDTPSTGVTTGTQGGSGGTAGAAGQLGGAAGQAGVTSQGGAAGQAGSGATSGGAGVAAAAGSAGASGAPGVGGAPGAGGAGGYPPDATVVDTGVVIDGSPKDVVASDTNMGGCCAQIDLSLCRFKVGAAYRTCWACTPGCYASLMPSTPVQPISKCTCDGRPAGQRCVKVENRCGEMIRAKVPNNGTKDLQPGDCVTTFTNAGFRIEGSTGCVGNTCDPIPHTLVEMNLGNMDWYDLSHVDGANLPIGFYLVKGSFTPPTTPQNECNCLDRECRIDIKNTTCIERNKLRNKDGKVFACAAECRVDPAGNPDHDVACCVNGASVPDKCLPSEPAIQRDYQMFRFPCPQAYSYPYDEMHEVDKNYVLCTCSAKPDYDAIFCP
jgi:hypothetical protein